MTLLLSLLSTLLLLSLALVTLFYTLWRRKRRASEWARRKGKGAERVVEGRWRALGEEEGEMSFVMVGEEEGEEGVEEEAEEEGSRERVGEFFVRCCEGEGAEERERRNDRSAGSDGAREAETAAAEKDDDRERLYRAVGSRGRGEEGMSVGEGGEMLAEGGEREESREREREV